MAILDFSAFGGLIPSRKKPGDPDEQDVSPYQIKSAASDTSAPNAFDHALTVQRMLHPETISSVNAPAPTPVQPHDVGRDFMDETYNQWQRSPDPYKRRIAWGEQAGPNVLYPTDRTAAENRAVATIDAGPDKAQGGFVGHLKGFGAGALLGGPLGAVAGAIKPQLVENIRHNIGVDRAAHEAGLERGIVDQQYGQGERMANMSGVNPFTGGLTESAKLREQQQQYLNAWRQTQAGFTNRRIGVAEENAETNRTYKGTRLGQIDLDQARKDKGLAIQLAREALQGYIKGGGTLTPEAREIMKAGGIANADTLPDEYDPKKVLYDPVGGTITTVSGKTGQIVNKSQTTPRPLTSGKVTPEMRAQATKAARDAVLGEWQKAGKVDASGTMPDPKYSAETLQALGKFAKRVPADKHAGFQAEVKARAAQMLQAKPSGQSDPRIGKVFTARDGKHYLIQSIGADGQPIGVPAP